MFGIADGMSIARVWVRWYSKWPPLRGDHFYRRAHTCAMDMPLRGGHFEYRHAHTRAMDMTSAMLR